MRSFWIFAATAALLVSAPAVADDTKVAIGISGWTGFAPLTLASQAGIFKKNGLDVTLKKIPQKDRHLAVASGDIRQLRRIQAPVQSFSQRGAPHQEELTGKFLLDLGSSKLPVNVFSRLLHQAKVATRLCGDCGSSLETEEPVLGTRSGLTSGQSC